jgi:hypothetical protein
MGWCACAVTQYGSGSRKVAFSDNHMLTYKSKDLRGLPFINMIYVATKTFHHVTWFKIIYLWYPNAVKKSIHLPKKVQTYYLCSSEVYFFSHVSQRKAKHNLINLLPKYK